MRRAFPLIVDELADRLAGRVPSTPEQVVELLREARAAVLHEAAAEDLALRLVPTLRSMAAVAYDGPVNGDARRCWRVAEDLVHLFGDRQPTLLAGAVSYARHGLVAIGPLRPELRLVEDLVDAGDERPGGDT